MLLWLAGHVGNVQERYYSYTLVITGLTGVLVMFPAVYFYRKDRIGRLIGGLTSVEEQRLSIPEMLLLLAAGAGFAQYANVLVAILQNWISSSYGETMTKITSGKSLFMMIFWMGIIAPVAEEMIFRWLIYLRLRDHFSVLFSAVISAAFFGIYHGNVLQAVYAFVLGGIFAWFLEMGGNKWTSVLMHIGANTWILIFSEYAQTLVEKPSRKPSDDLWCFCGSDDRRISCYLHAGEKNLWLPGLFDPMWITNICLLLDQAE